MATVTVGLFFGAAALLLFVELRRKHVFHWLGPYIRHALQRRRWEGLIKGTETVHVLFCVVDHFEPISADSNRHVERERVEDWLVRYPRLARRHRDSDGVPPQHTWFYPAERYDGEYLEAISSLCRAGFGEIELHLHHGHDTSESLRYRLDKALADFSVHGALITQGSPARRTYGFIHGDMALANSRFSAKYCGVDDELRVLSDTGCYADFSLPTAPCISQPKKVNQVYYASVKAPGPRSHDDGIDVEMGRPAPGGLLMIPGPLALNWSRRKWGLLPRIENGELQGSNPPSRARIRVWVGQRIHVVGRPEWLIVKVSCHGAEDRSRDALLGTPAEEMFNHLERLYRDREGYALHYVTARELYNIIKAAEAGKKGNPHDHRNFEIPPYRTAMARGPKASASPGRTEPT